MNAMMRTAVSVVLAAGLINSTMALAAGSEDLQEKLQTIVNEAVSSHSEVEVAVHDGGEVTLSGYIQDPDQLAMLEQQIRNVEGVTTLESTVTQSD